MKTTVDIADSLLDEAKRVAAEHNVTLRTLIENGLRHELAGRKAAPATFRLRDESFRGDGWHPDMQGVDPSRLREMAYEDPDR